MRTIEEAPWVEAPGCDSPLFRREFWVSHPLKVRIQICGLGFFSLLVNGQEVSGDRLVPAFSNYHPRVRENMDLIYPIQDVFNAYRTYYLEYDLLPFLRDGKNALGVALGNGWYHQNRRNVEGKMDYGTPRLCFVLTLESAEGETVQLTSGPELRWTESEILESNIYYGERQDLGRVLEGWSLPEFDDSGWKNAEPVWGPGSTLVRQECPPDRVIRSLSPRLILEEGNRRIYDCGENISGYVVLRCPAAPGKQVRICHSEELSPDRTRLDYASAGGERQIQADEYLCGEKERVCHPHFCWHGFRYFEVTGEAEVCKAEVLHSDVPVTAEFCCSDENLNWIFQAYLRTQQTNYHCGVPSDCPHRERLGYTGDGQVTAPAALLTLDCYGLLKKWMQDVADCQGTNGHVQHTAPFYGGGGGPGGWGGAICLVPMACYERTGDPELLRRFYPNMRQWLTYMDSRCENGLVVREEKDGWCLGDWCTPKNPAAAEPNKPEIPEPLINTYYYIKGLEVVRKAAELLGYPPEPVLAERRQASLDAFTRAYLDPLTGSFCQGVNGADAFGLDLGLGDERTAARLVERYEKLGRFDTGIFGTDLLIDMLFRLKKPDLAYRLLAGEGPASFGWMRLHGATTIWETWEGDCSHNHPMFGGVVRSLFTHILGIRQEGAGYRQVRIEPQYPAGLSWARGSIAGPGGRISVSWRREADGSIKLETSET